MRRIITVLFMFSLLFTPQIASAETGVVTASAVINKLPVASEFAKSYKISSENLLYLLLSAINESNYSIQEIQFKTGSVLFKAYSKEFLAFVSAKDGYNSFIKIVPADNNYNFSPILIEKLKNYIELNNTASFQKIL